MKKLLTFGLILSVTTIYAQSVKVASAKIDLDKGRLAEAYENIEAAILDPKTGIEAKTWKYRFDIIFAIAQSPKLEYRSLIKPEEVAVKLEETYKKLVEYDKKNQYAGDVKQTVMFVQNQMTNMGIIAFNKSVKITEFYNMLRGYNIIRENNEVDIEGLEKNLEALKTKIDSIAKEPVLKCLEGNKAELAKCLKAREKESFQMATVGFAQSAAMGEIIGVIDSASYYNAALSAEKAGMRDEAIELYKRVIEIKYPDENVYRYLSNLYKEKSEKDKALNIIKEGRAAYPNNLDLIIDELNFYLADNKFAEAEAGLKLAIEKDPTNDKLYYAVGSVYDNLKKFDEARRAYEKAIALNPSNFDAVFNMGALIFNEGVEMNNKANELDFRTKKVQIDELNKKADARFQEALKILEKALELKPDDKSVLQSLKQLYVRLEMTDKYNEVKKKLEGN